MQMCSGQIERRTFFFLLYKAVLPGFCFFFLLIILTQMKYTNLPTDLVGICAR